MLYENTIKNSFMISLISPQMNLYQIYKLNNLNFKINLFNLKIISNIYFQQVLLKNIQLNIISYMKKNNIPEITQYSFMGLSQSIIYGYANIYFYNKIFKNKRVSYLNILNGIKFGICRDIISNGLPDLYKNNNRLYIITLISIILSQGFHNCQTIMQTKKLNYINSIKYLYNKFGLHFLYKGFHNRFILFLYITFLNKL